MDILSIETVEQLQEMSTKRSIADLGYPLAGGVLRAIDLLETKYHAKGHRDSGHTKSRPMWIFELPHHGAEVGVPMNKRGLTLYMRNRTLDGRKLTDLIPPDKVGNVYPRDGKPEESIERSPFLRPSAANECLRLVLKEGDLEPLFEAFFATSEPAAAPMPEVPTKSPAAGGAAAGRAALDSEALDALLERRSKVGKAGESLAVDHEMRRLRSLGCKDPERWVAHVAVTDVGRGYDIASTWPGHERCIEVKSFSAQDGSIFITENERRVLASLGAKAWLYRVLVRADETGDVTWSLQDPIRTLPAEAFVPVVYRVSAAVLGDAVTAVDEVLAT